MFIPDYKVTGVDVRRKVGETVTVKCKEDFQLFTMDKWDSNSTDNTLNIICAPSLE